MIETRSSNRLIPYLQATRLSGGHGSTTAARIINLSRFGVAVEADMARACGEPVVMVGSKRIVYGRKIRCGMVFLFEHPIPPSRFKENMFLNSSSCAM